MVWLRQLFAIHFFRDIGYFQGKKYNLAGKSIDTISFLTQYYNRE